MKSTIRTRMVRSRWRVVPAVALSLVVAISSVVVAKPDNGKGKGKGRGNAEDFVPPGHRRAPVEVIVAVPPPPVRVEKIPVRPAPGYLWVPGYWVWVDSAYAWTPGVWMEPPEPAAVWVAPRYETRSSVSVYISGYWKL